MPNHHDVIVIGTSAGGVEALTAIVQSLPAEFDAAVFIVMHLSPHSPSYLPEILSRSGPLTAYHPLDRDPIRKGQIYVAPPVTDTPADWVQLSGRTTFDQIVVFEGPRELTGRILPVRVREALGMTIFGELAEVATTSPSL